MSAVGVVVAGQDDVVPPALPRTRDLVAPTMIAQPSPERPQRGDDKPEVPLAGVKPRAGVRRQALAIRICAEHRSARRTCVVSI